MLEGRFPFLTIFSLQSTFLMMEMLELLESQNLVKGATLSVARGCGPLICLVQKEKKWILMGYELTALATLPARGDPLPKSCNLGVVQHMQPSLLEWPGINSLSVILMGQNSLSGIPLPCFSPGNNLCCSELWCTDVRSPLIQTLEPESSGAKQRSAARNYYWRKNKTEITQKIFTTTQKIPLTKGL